MGTLKTPRLTKQKSKEIQDEWIKATQVTYPTLEHVAMEQRPYPKHVLEGAETGLVLFAAAFLGHNDAIHFAEAGMEWVVCVDVDEQRLMDMKQLYPYKWLFIADDAWSYAGKMKDQGPWDVVSLDPFTGDIMRRVIEDLELWCSLAKRYVVCGATTLATAFIVPPEGWKLLPLVQRAQDVYWVVLERQ